MSAPHPRVVPVILSGGAGTRLWPLSRRDRPKQFIALDGPSTMLQLTVARVTDADRFAPPLIVAAPGHRAIIEQQLADCSDLQLLLEPCARNTAPAIALAALAAPPDAILLVLPSDHLIGDVASFDAAVSTAAQAVAGGQWVTFGIRPTHPETGYGYIRRGTALSPGLYEGLAFAEKPDAETAARYVADGGYDWNAGIFAFRADAYLAALGTHAPDIMAASQAAMAAARRDGAAIFPDAAAFARAPAISIDYAVMEKVDSFAVVPVEMAWSDVGSWDAVYDLSPHDRAGNAVSGAVIALDARDCLLRADGVTLAAVDVADLIVVATPDAVLVVPRSQSQRVKQIVEMLNDQGTAGR